MEDVLRSSTRRFLARHSPPAAVRAAMDTERGWDEAVWRKCLEQGWMAIAVPEALGGVGAGWPELAVIFEEAGRALLCAPLLSSWLGLAAILEGGADDLVPALASGEKRATLCLDGRAIDGVGVDYLVVPESDGASVYMEFEAVPIATLDATRRWAEVTFEAGAGRPLGPGPRRSGTQRGSGVRPGLAIGRALLAAEQVGGAAWCLDASVEYATTRRQFGTPIGAFQAVKHMCAQMLLRVESARSAAMAAAADPSPLNVATAQAYCSEAFFFCASEAIQVHGGIGFTWEHDCHLYFKRARASEALLGTPATHREAVLEALGI